MGVYLICHTATNVRRRRSIADRTAVHEIKIIGLTQHLTTTMASGLEDSQLYMEENVEGKGTGCFANRDIKKGDLVLREAPQLLHPVLP